MLFPAPLLASLKLELARLDTPELRFRYFTGDFPRSQLTKDRNMRYRWDLLYAVPGYYETFCKPAYDAGLHDTHIDTALKACVLPL